MNILVLVLALIAGLIPVVDLTEFTETSAEDKQLHFSSPVSDESCIGFVMQREFSAIHNGLDYAKSEGCKITASEAGIVEDASWSEDGSGYRVIIEHSNGFKTLYLHGSGEYYVQKGDRVEKGQELMYMGCTGYCTGTHLHFSIQKDGSFVDPSMYLE